ncbi:hypothetical protein C0Q70_04894 [Pomacea canaliculata]|uniref:G-protein coupled receptors family 1 profile domain-containing protein n=1 Tax=Pomacea canaliculata TaxID=400727 RepID=A0A2T7PJM7_POMCA|nr:hypothetical protein C0Q70_04894 [Pomacea canaliculata]
MLETQPHSGQPASRVIFIIVGSSEIVCGVSGNLLLLLFLATRYSLHTHTVHNLFIVNLALTDVFSLGYWLVFFVLDSVLRLQPCGQRRSLRGQRCHRRHQHSGHVRLESQLTRKEIRIMWGGWGRVPPAETAYSAKNKAQRFQKKPKRKDRNVRPASGNEAELPNVTFDPENDPVSTTNDSDYTRDWRRTAKSCPMVHPHHRSSQAGNRKSGRQVDASTDNLSEDVLTSIEAPDELEECSRTPDSDLCSSSEEYSRFPSDTCNPQSSIARSEEQTAGQKGLDTRLDGEACCEALRSEVDKEHRDSEKHATDENGDEQSKETLSGGNHEDLEAELPNNQKSSVRKFPFKSNSTRTKGSR